MIKTVSYDAARRESCNVGLPGLKRGGLERLARGPPLLEPELGLQNHGHVDGLERGQLRAPLVVAQVRLRLGPDKQFLPRHTMTFNSRNKGLKRG